MQEKTLLNQANSTSNIHSSEVGVIFYDIFGSPYQKTGSFLATDSLDFGYLGKPYNADTELYDYGFRDYSPEIARFTSVDPIRDGRNWFCYVVNDPVNYVDLWGLQCKSENDEKVDSNEGYEELPFYTFDLALVGFFYSEATSSPYNLGKPLLIMNNDTTTSENSLPFIGTDKIEEIPEVISERNSLINSYSNNKIEKLAPNSVDIVNAPLDQANFIKKFGGTIIVQNSADSIFGKNVNNEVLFISDIFIFQMTYTYETKSGDIVNVEIKNAQKLEEN